jgi:hypothetical protein
MAAQSQHINNNNVAEEKENDDTNGIVNVETFVNKEKQRLHQHIGTPIDTAKTDSIAGVTEKFVESQAVRIS